MTASLAMLFTESFHGNARTLSVILRFHFTLGLPLSLYFATYKHGNVVFSYTHKPAYRHPFSGIFPGQPCKAGTRKVKTIWSLLKQEMLRWQWHQLNHMLIICTSIQTDNHTSTSSSNFFTGRMLFLTPNERCQST